MKFDTSKWTVKTILGMVGSKELVLQPDFQRFYIWDTKKEQGLVDSILRNYPIPPVWIWKHQNADEDIVYEVIDGQQRLTCIRRFINNEFPFAPSPVEPGTDELTAANNTYYDTVPAGVNAQCLSKKFSTRLMGYMVPYIQVETEDRPYVIDIFKRLNKSSTNLNPQEMRNAFYTGEFKSSVYEIAAIYQDDSFWGGSGRVFAKPVSDRMANQRFVSDLVVAMIEGVPQHQSNKLDDYYEKYDKRYEQRKEIERRFKKAVQFVRELFPDVSRFTKNTSDFYTLFLYMDEILTDSSIRKTPELTSMIRSTLSRFEHEYALYTERRDHDRLDGNIFERYRETIVGRQREKEVREIRREIIRNLIEPGVRRSKTDAQRLFSDEQKTFIWQVSPDKVCGICGQVVGSYEEYEPDHIVPWSKGGLTSIENGQISHKLCNSRKRDD